MLNFNFIRKATVVAMTASMGLAISGNDASALNFRFSGTAVGGSSYNGNFVIDDAVVPLGGGTVTLAEADFQRWNVELNITGAGTTALTTADSNIFNFPIGLELTVAGTDATIDFSTIDSGQLCILDNGGTACPSADAFFFANNLQIQGGDGSGGGIFQFTPLTASAQVPFDLSPTLGLLMIGGIYGVNRVRKSRKSLEK